MGAVRLPDAVVARLAAQGRLPAEPDRQAWKGAKRDASRAVAREDWPGALAFQCRASGLVMPVRELVFLPGRRFRFDLAFPDARVAVEVDGGAFLTGGGGHNRGSAFRDDCEKLSLAAAHGWRVLRVMPEHVRDGQALEWVTTALRWAPGIASE